VLEDQKRLGSVDTPGGLQFMKHIMVM